MLQESTSRSRFLLAGLAMIAMACISTRPAFVELPPPHTRAGVTVTVDQTVRAPYGFVGFKGSVTNATDKHLASCRITIEVLDHEMSPAGRARVSLVDVAAGETRVYQADLAKILRTVRTVPAPEVRLKWAANDSGQ